MFGHSKPSGFVQIAATRVIAQASPQVQYIIQRSLCEIGKCGKALHKALEVGDDRGNLSLLQHDLGDPDTIGCDGLLPRQILAAVAIKPIQYPCCEISV